MKFENLRTQVCEANKEIDRAQLAILTWGKDAMAAVTHARILEEVARIAAITLGINPGITAVDQYLLDKHYYRKHGKNAYYGQEKK